MTLARLAPAVLALSLAAVGCGGEEPTLTLEERLEQDDRIQPLLAGCEQGRSFTVDTSDMARVLAGNLVFSQLEPLRRSKSELADMGAAALPELQRVFDEHYADPHRHGVLENVLGTCALMDEPAGLPIAREALRHPHEGVRLAALDVMRKFGEVEDYDAIHFAMSIASNEENQADCAATLALVDPERFYLEFVDWLDKGEWRHLWRYTAPVAAQADDPVILDDFRRLTGIPDPGTAIDLRPAVRDFLVAALARSGDEAALGELRALLSDDDPTRRGSALTAAVGSSLVGEVRVVLEQDDLEALRAQAAAAIAENSGDEANDLLRLGLSDPGSSVRQVCRDALIRRGDGAARAQALEMLRQGIKERAEGLRALRLYWQEGSEGVEQAFTILAELFREQASGGAEAVGLLQSISQVPCRESAELLMEVGTTVEGEIRGWPAHRWCAFQSFNSGPEGLAYLRERHAVEEDPFRRLDYLAAIWQDHSDAAREVLRGVVLDERSTPYEILYAAELLIRIGPAAEQAPFLKRAVYFESTHQTVRPALQCLLWRWYGS